MTKVGEIYEESITRFDGGVTNDIRDTNTNKNKLRIVKGFDALSFPHRLVPKKSSESGQDTPALGIRDFVYVNSRLFGLGTSGSKATMFYQNDTGSPTWNQTANNQTATNDKLPGGFLVYYAKTGLIYGCSGAAAIFAYDPTGGVAFVDASATVTLGGAPRAVVHSKDDIMYVGGANKIHKNNNGSWTSNALTLPAQFTITALCEYGNYLAIAVKSADEYQQNSRVFLWNRDSSVATLDESIDWGIGHLRLLEEYEGQLIGASFLDDQIYGAVSSVLSDRLIVKAYNGQVTTFIEIVSDVPTGGQFSGIFGTRFQKIHGRLYFLAALVLDGENHMGVWSLGRSSPSQPIILTLEYLPNNDTAATTLDGFYLAGSIAYIAYNNAGAISKTDNSAHYLATSIVETLKLAGQDVSQKKKLIGVSVTHAPLPVVSDTGSSIVLKYKKNSDTSFTTILTSSTSGDVSHSATNIESSGLQLPEWQELQFRVESTGGAELTGVSFKYELVGKRNYE